MRQGSYGPVYLSQVGGKNGKFFAFEMFIIEDNNLQNQKSDIRIFHDFKDE